MIRIAGENIVSSLGLSAEENYRRVAAGESGLRLCEGLYGVSEPFMASLIDDRALNEQFHRLCPAPPVRYTPLEQAAVYSAACAIEAAGMDAAHPRVLFILSSVKGNVALPERPNEHAGTDRIHLWKTAQLVARHFGNRNTPVTVSNACISGACALLTARRELLSGRYDGVVAVGVDRLSKFIVSGFQSLKALSPTPCRPFDADRCGLNLGEAAAAVALRREDATEARPGSILLADGAVRNDASHITAPSRTGEGLYRALRRIMQERRREEIAFINAHGTATLYNDEMEAVALHRAGLDAVHVNGLKASFGHTLGAAGILESIISARALRNGTILKTQGFRQQGTIHPLHVSVENIPTKRQYFIKTLSGFGGCNAALLFKKSD
ncbi:MAG: beta-ketoacyl synthase [Bacteroidales bacterium]|nr:beta-ketoacyl synthase [Bacteroidales bacterium]